MVRGLKTLAIALLVVSALCSGGRGAGTSAATVVQANHAPSMLEQLSLVGSKFRGLVVALRAWLAALFKSVQEFKPWEQVRGANVTAGGGAGAGAVWVPSSNLEWNGVRATKKELDGIVYLRQTLASELASGKVASTTWLQNGATDREFLRFIRHHSGNKEAAWKSVKAHAQWRTSPYGCETIAREGHRRFADSPLNKEVFWLGLSKSGCPTLVVRTRAHDGANYNEDPKVFSSFFVWVLEQGRAKYGAGASQPICVVMDRGPFFRNGKSKGNLPDFSVIPRLVEVLKTLFGTINNNYPEILSGALVVPVNFFFKMCYRVTSRVMDKRSRDRFTLVPGDRVAKELLALFPAAVLPPHLGGSSMRGGLWDDGHWDQPGLLEEALREMQANEGGSGDAAGLGADADADAGAGAGSEAGAAGAGAGAGAGGRAGGKAKAGLGRGVGSRGGGAQGQAPGAASSSSSSSSSSSISSSGSQPQAQTQAQAQEQAQRGAALPAAASAEGAEGSERRPWLEGNPHLEGL